MDLCDSTLKTTQPRPTSRLLRYHHIRIVFVDVSAKERVLGYIRRVDGVLVGEGYAVMEIGGSIEDRSITPDDEEWDVIVGTIERAIEKARPLQAHQLAERIKQARVASETFSSFPELITLLDKCSPIIKELETRKFDENVHGYIKLTIEDETTSSDMQSPQADIITVIFVDPAGDEVTLGYIGRPDNGYAIAYVDHEKTEVYEITPDDEEWNIVVGCVERAARNCLD